MRQKGLDQKGPANFLNICQIAERLGTTYNAVYGAVANRGTVPYMRSPGGIWVHERFLEVLRAEIKRASATPCRTRYNDDVPELRIVGRSNIRRLRDSEQAVQA